MKHKVKRETLAKVDIVNEFIFAAICICSLRSLHGHMV